MRHILARSAIGSGLLLLGMTASAQYPPRTDRYYQDDSRARLLDRVRADLDSAESSASSFNGDMDRISIVRSQIGSFQRRLDTGYFDERELTAAIVSVERVLDHNPLYDQTRDRLVSDLNRLRDMRSDYSR